MSEYTPLLCPDCGGNIAAKVTTSRTITFGDDEYARVGLWAKTPKEYWGHPRDEDGEECEDLTCSDTDCESVHNYDPQKNRELLNDPEVDKQFDYDWDYMNEEDEDVEKVTRFYCMKYNCDWNMTVTQQMNSHITMENVG